MTYKATSWAADKDYSDPKSIIHKDFSSPITDFHEFAIYNHHGEFTYGNYKYLHDGRLGPLRRTQIPTPPELAIFAVNSGKDLLNDLVNQTREQLKQKGIRGKELDHPLGYPTVRIIDPFVGTGIFIDLQIRYHMTPEQLVAKWNTGYIQAYDLDPVSAMVAAVNFELAYATITGTYRRCWFVACIDTFQLCPKTGIYKCQEDNVVYTEAEMWEWFHV